MICKSRKGSVRISHRLIFRKLNARLDIFKFDPEYLENEEKYKSIKAEILGEDSDEESGSEEESNDEDEDEDEGTLHSCQSCQLDWFFAVVVEAKEGIEDRTETNLVNLRRVIYLTIMNALNYEEAVHKLLKVQIDEGQEVCTLRPVSLQKLNRHQTLDRVSQHDHRMLLSRAVVFYLLWSCWWTTE